MTPLGPAKPSLTSFLEALRSSGGLRFEYAIHTREPDADTTQSTLTEVTLSGPDTPLLLERNGELLHAIESLAAAILRLEPEQAEQLSFDADGFKAARLSAITQSADSAVATVHATGKPFLFPPMNSRERRLLHLALIPSGLATASSGLGPRRFVVLYPAGQTPDPERFEPRANRSTPFRNQSGYKSGQGSSVPQQRRPPASSVSDERNSPSPAQDLEGLGNRQDAATSVGGGEPLSAARLDSIRRAFRKR